MKTIGTGCRCPLCQEAVPVFLTESTAEYRFWSCSVCGLVFADPLEYSVAAYEEGYGATDSTLNEMAEYARHLHYIEELKGMEDLTPHLTPLERRALRWLGSHIPPGATILDVGCGAGRFLMALQRCGYDARGLEVAESPVRALQGLGLPVRQGTLDDFPGDWPEPVAIVCFEVLEHLPDPLGFVTAIRCRFPRAILLLAVPYSASRRRRDEKFRKGDAPPNHLTRWTPAALRSLFVKGGYVATVDVVHVTGDHLPLAENPLIRIARREKDAPGLHPGDTAHDCTASADGREGEAGIKGAAGPVKRMIRRMIQLPYVVYLRCIGASGYWLLAVAGNKE